MVSVGKNKKVLYVLVGIVIFISFMFFLFIVTGGYADFKNVYFKILSNPDNKEYMDKLIEYGKENDIEIFVEYMDDLEAIDELEEGGYYDAIWLSNSIWLYMLDDVNITNSKSISINPVVMGIKKSKAESLDFVNNDIYNRDIMNAIKEGNLKYVMSSVTKTNTGLTAYLGFLNSLAGSPEILTSDMLDNNILKNDLKNLFKGVERVSGSDTFLEDMFLSSDSYEAVIATESSLININKELVKNNKEPLYLLYPKDGVAINDSPFAYVDCGQEKLEAFNKLQSFLLSNTSQKELQSYGKRTWYGGINYNVDKSVFNPSWGIDTTKYLIPLKYPSKTVINKSLDIYISELRKPASVAFCLDYSGSMYGSGKKELVSAMEYILDSSKASEELLQFSKNDLITVIPFSSQNIAVLKSKSGTETYELINNIRNIDTSGSTDIYSCSIEALKQVNQVGDDYTKTVILMTDGMSNAGSDYEDLYNYYTSNNLNIPIYSITFGSADRDQLYDIAYLTNAKIFNGEYDLIKAFKEVRSYN